MSDRLKAILEQASLLSEQEQEAIAAVIEGELTKRSIHVGRTLDDAMKAGLELPTVEGKPRPDGIPWSEIEASHDAA